MTFIYFLVTVHIGLLLFVRFHYALQLFPGVYKCTLENNFEHCSNQQHVQSLG